MSVSAMWLKDVPNYIKQTVYGFIHKSQKLMASNTLFHIVPISISNLCLLYYYAYNILPKIISKNALCLVNKKEGLFTTLKDIRTSEIAYAIFEPWNKGICQLRITGIVCTGNATSIGLITKLPISEPYWLFDVNECGISYQLFNNSKAQSNAIYHFQNGNRQSKTTLSQYVWSTYNTMGIKVDFNQNIVRFYFNSIQIGKEYKFPKHTIFYPAICYACKNTFYNLSPLVYRLEFCSYNERQKLKQELKINPAQIINELQSQVKVLKYANIRLKNEIEKLQINERQDNINDDCKECKKWQDKYNDLEAKYMTLRKKMFEK
eukprot:317779_1